MDSHESELKYSESSGKGAKRKKRKGVVEELLVTESNYVNDLRLTVEVPGCFSSFLPHS